jgi:hypothetical protein
MSRDRDQDLGMSQMPEEIMAIYEAVTQDGDVPELTEIMPGVFAVLDQDRGPIGA